MARPNSRATLIEYCLRNLGDPVIEININPDQLEDIVSQTLQHWQEYHDDATVCGYLKHQITAQNIANLHTHISTFRTACVRARLK